MFYILETDFAVDIFKYAQLTKSINADEHLTCIAAVIIKTVTEHICIKLPASAVSYKTEQLTDELTVRQSEMCLTCGKPVTSFDFFATARLNVKNSTTACEAISLI